MIVKLSYSYKTILYNTPAVKVLNKKFPNCITPKRGCGVGIGVAKSRRFLGGVGSESDLLSVSEGPI